MYRILIVAFLCAPSVIYTFADYVILMCVITHDIIPVTVQTFWDTTYEAMTCANRSCILWFCDIFDNMVYNSTC